MDLALAGRIALVADAAAPVGRALARLLAAEGCRPILAGRDSRVLEALADDLEGGALVRLADLRDPVEADVLALQSGEADLLFACAPGAPPPQPGAPLDKGWEDRVLGLSGLIREIHSLMAQKGGETPKAIVVVGVAGGSLGAKAGNAALFAVVRHLAALKVPDISVAGIDPGAATPEEAAAAALFLASSQARPLNGAVLVLEGA